MGGGGAFGVAGSAASVSQRGWLAGLPACTSTEDGLVEPEGTKTGGGGGRGLWAGRSGGGLLVCLLGLAVRLRGRLAYVYP